MESPLDKLSLTEYNDLQELSITEYLEVLNMENILELLYTELSQMKIPNYTGRKKNFPHPVNTQLSFL